MVDFYYINWVDPYAQQHSSRNSRAYRADNVGLSAVQIGIMDIILDMIDAVTQPYND